MSEPSDLSDRRDALLERLLNEYEGAMRVPGLDGLRTCGFCYAESSNWEEVPHTSDCLGLAIRGYWQAEQAVARRSA